MPKNNIRKCLWFEYEYLTGNIEDIKKSVYDRTHQLFYVSCSRAIKNLAVLYLNEQKSIGLDRVEIGLEVIM